MHALKDVLASLEALAPLQLAAPWDNVGLLLGQRNRSVTRVMTCLTLTPASAAEAVARRADLVVSHHPLLFRGTKRLTSDTTEGQIVLELLRGEVAVYSPHTAFDNCPGGINDQLAGLLGLQEIKPLRRRDLSTHLIKLVVFTPQTDLERVSQAAFAVGAGVIGEYDSCSFRIPGTGTFRGSMRSNPTVGKPGVFEEAAEIRLEMVCPEAQLPALLAAVKQAHSYETPAMDVYPLAPLPGPGEGRLGRLAPPISLAELADRVKAVLPAKQVGVVGDPAKRVETVGLACGAAGEYVADALQHHLDALLTGEARFHE
ncbi:MAG: Nif3-like dinuclear metal center hexameric protein, partial [Gemmataceae bacterium]